MTLLKHLRTVVAWAALVAAASPAWAGQAQLQLQGSGSEAYYGVQVPLWLREQARSADLSDVRVLNAQGEQLPYAWHVGGLQTHTQARHTKLPFFKTPPSKRTDTEGGIGGVGGSGASRVTEPSGWIIDTRAVKGTLLTLQLTLEPRAQGVYRFALESSADLQQWQTVRGVAQLVALQRNGALLENNTFDIAGVQAKYLRIQPLQGSSTPALAQVSVSSVERYVQEPALQWGGALQPTHCEPTYCDYTLSPRLPIEQIEWQLAQPNTLAAVQLLVQYEAASSASADDMPTPNSTSTARRHPLREHLHGLRHKTRPSAPNGAQAWVPLARTSVYWLQLPEGDVRSAPTQVSQGLYARLRVQIDAGMQQLGPKPPTLRIATRPVSMVFLARQSAPFALTWGGAATDAAMPLQQLMPMLPAGQLPPLDTATVLAPEPAPAVAALVAKPAQAVPPSPTRKYWLWAVLLGALVAMGVMAWSLLRRGAGVR